MCKFRLWFFFHVGKMKEHFPLSSFLSWWILWQSLMQQHWPIMAIFFFLSQQKIKQPPTQQKGSRILSTCQLPKIQHSVTWTSQSRLRICKINTNKLSSLIFFNYCSENSDMQLFPLTQYEVSYCTYTISLSSIIIGKKGTFYTNKKLFLFACF